MSRTRFGFAMLVLGFGAALGPGCSTGELNTLEEARLKWSESGITSYSYSLQRGCFCPPESIGPVRITVVNGQVVSRTLIETSQAVTDTVRWPPIEGLFEYAERVLREADEGTVEFHPDFGFPMEISADWIRDAVDDEENLRVTSFTPAEGSSE